MSLERLECALDGGVGRRQGRKGKDHDAEAHFARLLRRDERRCAIIHAVEQQRPRRQVPHRLSRSLFGGEAFQQAHVGANGSRSFEALDAFVVTVLFVGVGAGDEDDVGLGAVFGRFGGADAREEDLHLDHLFALQVAAPFGLHLLLDIEPGHPGADVLEDRICDHDWSCARSENKSENRIIRAEENPPPYPVSMSAIRGGP